MSEVNMVHDTGQGLVKDDRSWLVSARSGGVQSVTLDLDAFKGKEQYLTGFGTDSSRFYLVSGIPLAREDGGLYGPYEADATDGRQGQVAGFLESNVAVRATVSGWKVDDPNVGLRYRADIRKENLPVTLPEGTRFAGDIYQVPEDGDVVRLSA